MGLFLSISGVISSAPADVESAIQRYAASREGQFVQEALTTEDDDCLVISEEVGGVAVLYPATFLDWDDASKFLSKETGKPVFSFHIHDGDLWMYLLFDKGKVVDQFNPVPDYWQELDDEERETWRGSASEVAKRVPGLSPESISKYLTQWGMDVIASGERKKAYPDDKFSYGDDWQLVDFMKRLGLNYPIDDRGSVFGTTYRFKCES